MEQQVTKKQMKEIIKRQPKIVLRRLDFTKLESLGVQINCCINSNKNDITQK